MSDVRKVRTTVKVAAAGLLAAGAVVVGLSVSDGSASPAQHQPQVQTQHDASPVWCKGNCI